MTSTSGPRPLVSTSSEITATTPLDATKDDSKTAVRSQDATGYQSSAPAAPAAELASTKISLLGALRHFPDFPISGINFIDILPLFQDPTIHAALLRALELRVLHFDLSDDNPTASTSPPSPPNKPDVIVGLDARGFLFGPSLALRLNAGFVAVRKKGKLPGPCVTAAYEKEYGTDFFQMQEGAIKPGQKVLVVDDIIATGKILKKKKNDKTTPTPYNHEFHSNPLEELNYFRYFPSLLPSPFFLLARSFFSRISLLANFQAL